MLKWDLQNIFERFDTFNLLDIYVRFIWDGCGIYMGFLWDLYGIYMGVYTMGFIWDFYGSPQQYIWWPAADIGREKSSHREVFFCLGNHRFCLFLGAMVDFKEVCMRFEWDLHNWFLILSKSIVMYFIGFCTYFEFHLHWDLYLNMRNPYLFVYLYLSKRMRSVVVKHCICICVSICICICICSGVRSSSGREAQPPTAACPHSVCPVQRLSRVRFYIFRF